MDPSDAKRKALLEQAIAKDPKFAEAYAESSLYELTTDFENDEEQAKAIKTGEELNRKALALDPDCVPALVHLSAFRRIAGAVQEADTLLERGLTLSPTFMRANLFAGFRAERADDEAYAYVRRAHAVDPEIRRVMFFLYRMARAYKLSKLAERWLVKINALTPDLQLRNMTECQQLILKGEYAKALDRLRLFPPDLRKDRFSVPEMIYAALMGSGMYEAALAQLDRLTPDDEPHFPEIDRAELLLRLGRIDEARKVAESFMEFQMRLMKESKPTNQPPTFAFYRLARALQILGRPTEAVQELEKFAKLEPMPMPYPEPWPFRENPAALAILAKLQEKSDLIAKRILEIEETYTSPALDSALR